MLKITPNKMWASFLGEEPADAVDLDWAVQRQEEQHQQTVHRKASYGAF